LKVMVTGAGGMLADAVGAHLAREGDEPFGVFFSDTLAAAAHERYPRGVVCEFGRGADGEADLQRFERAAAQFRPDWIFHLAAWTDVDGCEEDPGRAMRCNADACREVAVVARACSARLLSISTDYVFDGLATAPYREDAVTAPASVYGRAKLAGETYVRESGAEALVVRAAWLFGPAGKNFVDTIRGRLLHDLPVRVVDDQRGCPTSTPDLASALRKLAALDARGTVHVVNAGDATWYELAREIARHLGREPLVSAMTTEELGRPAPRPRYSVLDASRYAALAGAPLPDWRDALRRHLEAGKA
jgi:dTDP-4-dehydrorhamnose reductase